MRIVNKDAIRPVTKIWVWVVIAAMVGVLASSGCKFSRENPKGETQAMPPLVKTMAVGRGGQNLPHIYSGEVRGRFETRLAFRVPGKIIRRHVDPGTIVKSGDIIMEIDPSDIRQAVEAGRAQLSAARSQFNLAKDQLRRFKELYKEELMSKAELDRYQNAHDSARAMFKQARAQFTRAGNQLAYCRLKADSPGVVLSVHADAGQVVAAGQPVVVVARGDQREIEIAVPENRIAECDTGKGFKVSFWALQGLEVAGRVREISPVADPITRTYRARISLNDPPETVKLGMTASAVPDAGRNTESIFIPVSAVYQTGDTPTVWIIENKKVHQRTVKIGALGSGEQVQVTDGLNVGDRIVTAGVHKLREGIGVRTGDQAR